MNGADRTDNALVRNGIAVLAVMLTVIVYVLLEESTGSHVSAILFLPAVLASLFYGGVWPGYLAAVLSLLALINFALSSPGGLGLPNLLRIGIAFAGFLMACALVQGREKKIRHSIASLSSAVGAAVEGIVRLDRNGRIVECDDHFAQLVGSSDIGVKNRPLLELIMPEDREAMMKAGRQCWKEGKAEVEVRILWRGAAPHDVHLMLARTDNVRGGLAGIYCFMKDISQRKRELEELRQGRERLEVAFRHGVVGMTVSDVEGKWLEVNPAFCRLVGYQAEELIGRHCDAITHVEDRARDAAALRRFAGGEIDHCVTDKRYLSRSGQTIGVRVSIEAVHDENGKPAYLVSQVQERGREG